VLKLRRPNLDGIPGRARQSPLSADLAGRHMFRWENLLYACSLCNSLAHKGSRMEWTARGRTKLLDPSAPGDDPLCYLSIGINAAADVPLGWMDPRAGLATEADYCRGRPLRVPERADTLSGTCPANSPHNSRAA
jgi:hypothetical protein